MADKNLNEIILNRRATPPRFLAKKEIPKEIIMRLLENANWAPSHKKTEPWRFRVYLGESKKKLAKDIYDLLQLKIKSGEPINPQKVEKFYEMLQHVPVAIALFMQRDPAERLPEWEEIAAVSMAVQNMWLSATEMDLGAFWATPGFLPHLSEILNLKPGQKAMGFFYVGQVALEYPAPGRGRVEDKIEWRD